MSYTALYRKFRPSDFDEVKGQDHIVTTLKNQILNQRIGHAYLFTGTRGTGKTTVAKILAKAVNCENLVEGSPCNECTVCKSINEGASVNVVEFDAASNNSVEAIRQIVEEVQYPPTEGKYRVYIIDEVHMLSTAAFNALLKTLEEPPSYVIFILATTEVHKIPITILSRCQRYDFKRITIDTISNRLEDLISREGIEVEEKAIRYIAKVADGSMRDALSLLDQCIAFYLGEKLTYDNVLACLGAVDTEIFSRLLRNVNDKNIVGSIGIVEEIIQQGREIGQFIIDFTWYLRNLLLIKSSSDMEDVLDISTDNLKLLREEAEMTDDNEVMRYIRILSELSNQIKYATGKRVLVEIALIKMCKPAMETDMSSVMQRLDDMEQEIASGAIKSVNVVQAPVSNGFIGNASEPQEPPMALSEDIQEVADNFHSIIPQIENPMVKNLLTNTRGISYKENSGKLQFVANKMDENKALSQFMEAMQREDRFFVESIEEAILKVIGKKVEVEAVTGEDASILKGAHALDFRNELKSKNIMKNLDFEITQNNN